MNGYTNLTACNNEYDFTNIISYTVVSDLEVPQYIEQTSSDFTVCGYTDTTAVNLCGSTDTTNVSTCGDAEFIGSSDTGEQTNTELMELTQYQTDVIQHLQAINEQMHFVSGCLELAIVVFVLAMLYKLFRIFF